MKYSQLLKIVGVLFLASACAPIKSTLQHANKPVQGMLYQLPKKDIIVNFERTKPSENACVDTINFESTETYADPSYHFAASLPTHQFGTNKSVITVSEKGLLNSAVADAPTDIDNIIETVAQLAAATSTAPIFSTSATTSVRGADNDDCIPTKKTFLIDGSLKAVGSDNPEHSNWYLPLTTVEGRKLVFELPENIGQVEITSFNHLSEENHVEDKKENNENNENNENSADSSTDNAIVVQSTFNGLAYRRIAPFLVNVTKNSKNASAMVAPPKVMNIPDARGYHIAKTPTSIFGNKKATLTFSDGVLTQYDAEFSGDVIEVLSIPAKIVSALSKAAGDVFSQQTVEATAEIEYLEKAQELGIERLKFDECSAALNSKPKDEAKIEAFCK